MIKGYVLYLDGGTSGSAFSVVAEDQIADKFYLRAHTVQFAEGNSGKTYRFMLEAKNEIGSVSSPISSQLLAGIPAKPAD